MDLHTQSVSAECIRSLIVHRITRTGFIRALSAPVPSDIAFMHRRVKGVYGWVSSLAMQVPVCRVTTCSLVSLASIEQIRAFINRDSLDGATHVFPKTVRLQAPGLNFIK